jgi:arginase family enzyme
VTPLTELSHLLKPAGGGLYLVSTGKAEQLALQQHLYQVDSVEGVQAAFEVALARVATAKGLILGVPSDVGAGFQRGANLGPQGIRRTLLDSRPRWAERLHDAGIVDVGDVFVVPQLLHDDMLSEAQYEASHRALYPGVKERLPVSPLSIAERAFELLFTLNPTLMPFTLGGDHSTALPVVKALHRARGTNWAIVQSDAHTDLLAERLGVRECFATWSYHANELLGRGGKVVQLGIRATGRTQAHWETTLGVRQFWAAAIRAKPEESLEAILAHVRQLRVGGVYFSNDIDGTDSAFADATGTPEPEGLHPDWLVEVIRRLGREQRLIGGDVMEVAPSLTRTPVSAQRTLALAARYLEETLNAALGTTV